MSIDYLILGPQAICLRSPAQTGLLAFLDQKNTKSKNSTIITQLSKSVSPNVTKSLVNTFLGPLFGATAMSTVLPHVVPVKTSGCRYCISQKLRGNAL